MRRSGIDPGLVVGFLGPQGLKNQRKSEIIDGLHPIDRRFSNVPFPSGSPPTRKASLEEPCP
jgi:hypothetical protein